MIKYNLILADVESLYAVVNVLVVHSKITGDNGKRDPPVLIPNTEVKPLSADGTWLETARESRTLPVFLILLSSAGRACGC